MKCHSLRKYNITHKDYVDLLAKQGGVCAICGQQETIKHKNKIDTITLAVDHCHTTGKIRGLLCHRCNTSLGQFEENIDLLKNTIDYINRNNYVQTH